MYFHASTVIQFVVFLSQRAHTLFNDPFGYPVTRQLSQFRVWQKCRPLRSKLLFILCRKWWMIFNYLGLWNPGTIDEMWDTHAILSKLNTLSLFYKPMIYRIIHYSDVIMSTMATQITSVSTVYSSVCSGADQWKYQSFVSLAFVSGIHRWPVDSPHKGSVTRRMFPFDDVILHQV